MGYTVLYIAFGVVALWLLGEVLLQYKAQLRWRVLAFVGFMGVVGGVYLQTIALIALGAAAFAVGQTFVTVSYRRGFSTGWALGGGPGSSKRRRDGGSARSEPTLSVSEIEPVGGGYPEQYQEQPPYQPVYQPQPIADETGEYAAYGAPSYATGAAAPSYAADGTPSYGAGADGAPSYAAAAESVPSYAADGTPSYATDGYPAQDPLAGSGYDGYGGWDSGGYPAYPQPEQGADAYAAAAEQAQYQQQGGYEDPYAGTGAVPGADPGQYPYQDPYQVPYQDPYAANGYADPYADPYGSTPAGGVWVPQQQAGEPYVPPAAPDQAAGYDPYRY